MLQKLKSKVILKISVLIVIEIILIVGSFATLAFFQSQGSSLGNSINIAGKNRFLTERLLLQVEKYLDGSLDVIQVQAAMNNLQANIRTLKEGGTTSEVFLKALPSEFLKPWELIDKDWNIFRATIMNNIIIEVKNGQVNISPKTSAEIATEKKEIESEASQLIKSSDVLVTKLGEQVDSNSRNLMLLQTFFGILIIGILILVLYLVSRILKPITSLTHAISEVEKGNLDVSLVQKGTDELAVLEISFNAMVNSIKKYIDRQKELTKTVAIKNDELLEIERDLRRANQELVKTELAKEEFIAMVSHELKTPLTPLKLYSEMFLKTNALGSLNDKQKQTMQMMHKNISKLEMLVNDIMDVYKLDIGKLRLNKKKVRVSELVNDNISDLQPLMEDKNIELDAVIDPHVDKLTVVCDSKRIGQVFSNLIKNSVDFVPSTGGKITIMAGVINSNDNVSFTVEDNGSGIPFEKMDNLFKTFYQIDTSIIRKHGGTGLGLAICKGIIEAHHGEIWIDKSYRGGTSITFTLPITYTP
jgi:signal transduction histidine kinase